MGLLKDFFYFSRGQRIGLLVLLVLLALLVAANFLVPHLRPQTASASARDTLFAAEVRQFQNSLRQQSNTSYSSREPYDFSWKMRDSKAVSQLFVFDPNTLDSAGFVRLGLRRYVARNIVRYRQHGGIFRTPDDLAAIYGISAEQFAELEPYIRIGVQFARTNQLNHDTAQPLERRQRESLSDIVVDLNTADTTLLKQLPGIGSWRACQIVRYRRSLGGFYKPEQLLEIKNFPTDVYERIVSHITVTPDSIYPIYVNRASVERLKRHPYINFYQAKAIHDLRYRQRNGLQSLNDLRQLSEFTPEDLERIAPYLDFTVYTRK